MNSAKALVLAAILALTPGFSGATAQETPPAAAAEWTPLDPENTLYLETAHGRAVIVLAPWLAPRHVAQIKQLARDKFYDGLRFYRVIENFVAQFGEGETADKPPRPTLPMEADVFLGDRVFTPVQVNDLFAPQTGFVDGFAMGRLASDGPAFAAHCYGALAMARDDDPNSGTTELYIVNGQAPRHLDRNMTVFGRVVAGMDVIQKVARGDPAVASGVLADQSQATLINRVVLAADLPPAERVPLEMLRTDSAEFASRLTQRRERTQAFFFRRPPAVLDICTVPVPVRVGQE